MNAPFPMCKESISPIDLRDPGEAARIEGFVASMPGNLPFHRPAWLQAVEQATGQRATGLVAEKGGVVTGWLPLTEVHSPLFGRALVSSGFAIGGGVLAERKSTAQALCDVAQEMALRSHCPTVELRGGYLPEGWDITQDSHCNFAGPLSADDEAQLLAIPRKQRAEVRKGLAEDLEVSIGTSEADRAAHYAVYAESVHNLGTPVFPRALFDAMLDMFGDSADILTLRHQGEPVASVLSFYHGYSVMPYWGGGVWAARRLRANERMYYELMLHARKRGYDRFDFGRSKTNSGPYFFKKNWGFEPEVLSYASWAAPGHAKRNIDPTSGSYSRKIELWKKLPLSVANRIGPFIAKGLA
ncbi:MAG: FemAB family PEP-CTERM system-associated protein [Sphingomonadaceae bacterium]|nr:FemAB family PEP-CTERM system-associated protein [Sphingomonadaceae bacterium]